MWRKLTLISIICILVVGLTGCISLTKKTTVTTSNLGGMFLTTDRFETWKHISALMTPGEVPGSIGGTNTFFIRFDPSDEDAIYVGTKQNGLFYSYSGGNGWTKSKTLPKGFIRDLVINPKDKCMMYAGVLSGIYKSEDCARTWQRVWYSDNEELKQVASLAIDWYEPTVIYAGITDGTLMKTENSGETWYKAATFKSRINKIIIDPNYSVNVYVGVIGNGLFKTIDKGKTWENLNVAMGEFKNSNIYHDFVVSTTPRDHIVYANKYGILRSKDGGKTWLPLNISSKSGEELFYSVAVDPTNANYIYYATNSALFKSLDGGESWATKKMPTTRVVADLEVHPTKPNLIFMGAKEDPIQ